MWRRLLAVVHPDGAGTHELFIWVQGLHEHVAGDHIEPVRDERPRRARYNDPHGAERVDFDAYADFTLLTERAVVMADAVAEPFAFLLRALRECYPAESGPLYDQQRRGATYRSLAAIGHAAGMSKAERGQWYKICESIPLSQRHAGHILSTLKRRAA